MSYRRSFQRLAVGLALASIVFAGCVSVAAAMQGEAQRTPTPIPAGEGQPIDWSTVEVIPYLSHGTLTAPDVKAAAARTGEDPYLTDVYVRPGESLGGPDGGPMPERAERQPSVEDIGSNVAEECQRLLWDGGQSDELTVCLDLGARGGGEVVWTDRD